MSPTPAPRPSSGRSWAVPSSVLVAAGGWVVANVGVLVSIDHLPFDWPGFADRTVAGRLIDVNLAAVEVLLLIGLIVFLTRRRVIPDIASRAPERTVAAREVGWLVAYGAVVLAIGFVVPRLFGWHPFSLHLDGTLYGTHDHVARAEALTWAAYNLVMFAVIPFLWFRRRYTSEQLCLRSSDRGKDAALIVIVLTLETAYQVAVLRPDVSGFSGSQLAVGAVLTFLLFMAGAVLPAMIFIYAILVPRYLRLTGSTATTVILGGVTYALLHIWDAWAIFTSPGTSLLSLVFVMFTYFGPGMVKTVLTLRTGNAWVHVWAYHAISPHTLHETPLVIEIFRLR